MATDSAWCSETAQARRPPPHTHPPAREVRSAGGEGVGEAPHVVHVSAPRSKSGNQVFSRLGERGCDEWRAQPIHHEVHGRLCAAPRCARIPHPRYTARESTPAEYLLLIAVALTPES
mmetsp:Transcript_2704/g.8326  ORF Transcript_2704/g.8326 Transcript_2704/m.8326 type:complete len:118 (-) Transcript_2704:1167-1520(-)